MNLIAGGCYLPLQHLHRPQYPLPHLTPLQVALLEHGIRPHRGMDRRVLAVALHEDLGGAHPRVVSRVAYGIGIPNLVKVLISMRPV